MLTRASIIAYAKHDFEEFLQEAIHKLQMTWIDYFKNMDIPERCQKNKNVYSVRLIFSTLLKTLHHSRRVLFVNWLICFSLMSIDHSISNHSLWLSGFMMRHKELKIDTENQRREAASKATVAELISLFKVALKR